ncbi:hypothetical protein L1887_31488 [Cichorium endivia]|nr:hypothetical protein L1887_31488 [Cichorium endivia]
MEPPLSSTIDNSIDLGFFFSDVFYKFKGKLSTCSTHDFARNTNECGLILKAVDGPLHGGANEIITKPFYSNSAIWDYECSLWNQKNFEKLSQMIKKNESYVKNLEKDLENLGPSHYSS